MKQFSYVLTRPVRPHARMISRLIQEASRFSSRICICKDDANAMLKKAGDVFRLNLMSGSRITITVEGKDEEAAVAAIQSVMVAEF